MTNALVLRFSHLVKLKHADKAKAMLEKVASMVKPIMRKHSWTLPLLSEMLPDNPGLLGLNVNGGEKILLRLRPHHAPDTFLEFEDVIGTMLHELTHNVHGPHDAKFYAFLAKLNDEYDALAASGWRGDGFHSDGVRIGVGRSHDVPMHVAKEKAIKAAEERIRVQGLLAGGGRALGGSGVAGRAGKSPRELAAEAAERRLKDDRTCGVDQAKEAEKASRDGVIEINDDENDDAVGIAAPVLSVVDKEFGRPTQSKTPEVVGDSDDEIQIVEPPPRTARPTPGSASGVRATSLPKSTVGGPSARRAVPNPAQRPHPTAPAKPAALTSSSRLESASTTVGVDPSASVDVWPCPACTYDNSLSSTTCAICTGPRPALSAGQKAMLNRHGWTCATCGQAEIGTEWWTCVTAGCPGVRGWS